MSRSDVTAALWADMTTLAVISLPPRIPWQYQFDMLGLYNTRTGQLRHADGVAAVSRKGLNRISAQSAAKTLLRLLPRCDDQILPQAWPYAVNTIEDLASLHALPRIPAKVRPLRKSKSAAVAVATSAAFDAVVAELEDVREALRVAHIEIARLTVHAAYVHDSPAPSPVTTTAPDTVPASVPAPVPAAVPAPTAVRTLRSVPLRTAEPLHEVRIKTLEACVRVLFGRLDVPAATVDAASPSVAHHLAVSVAVQAYRSGALTDVDIKTEESFLKALTDPRMGRKLWLAVHPDKVRLPCADADDRPTGHTTLFNVVSLRVVDTLKDMCATPLDERLWRHEWWCIHEYMSFMEWRAALHPRMSM